jgi:hypothetical protein
VNGECICSTTNRKEENTNKKTNKQEQRKKENTNKNKKAYTLPDILRRKRKMIRHRKMKIQS